MKLLITIGATIIQKNNRTNRLMKFAQKFWDDGRSAFSEDISFKEKENFYIEMQKPSIPPNLF